MELALHEKMAELGIESEDTFKNWREHERGYLHGMERAPKLDRLAIEYVKTLKALEVAERKAVESRNQWLATPAQELRNGTFYSNESGRTRRQESSRKHGYESVITLQSAALDYEAKLGIDERWLPEFEEWQEACRSENELEYTRAVDRLEFLVVSRLFELSKLNRAGTGYKMRKHITKALKTRSKAIRNAVKKYNAAAVSIEPPREELDVEDVLDYVFLAQFDLLRDSRGSVMEKDWARPAAREATTMYFKLMRSKEEIRRLNVEARRLNTFVEDSERALNAAVVWLKRYRPVLATQMQKRLDVLASVNQKHRNRLAVLEGKLDFSGEAGAGQVEKSIYRDINSNPPQLPDFNSAETTVSPDAQMGKERDADEEHGSTQDSDSGEDEEDDDEISAGLDILSIVSQ